MDLNGLFIDLRVLMRFLPRRMQIYIFLPRLNAQINVGGIWKIMSPDFLLEWIKFGMTRSFIRYLKPRSQQSLDSLALFADKPVLLPQDLNGIGNLKFISIHNLDARAQFAIT